MSFADDPDFADSVRKIIEDWFGLPDSFKESMTQFIGMNGLSIPLSQVTGLGQWTVQQSTPASGTVTTASASFVSLSGGPTITMLSDGVYIAFFGASFARTDTSGGRAECASRANSDIPAFDGAAATDGVVFTSIVGVQVLTLRAGQHDNTIEVQYTTNGTGTASFARRYLYALRVAN